MLGGLLRTGELLGLRNKDVSQEGLTSVAVISLGVTKGGKRAGAAESVTTEADTLRRLWQWKRATSPGTSLCPQPHQWRKMFNDTISSLGLTEYQYRPYSLRRGGATFTSNTMTVRPVTYSRPLAVCKDRSIIYQ
jgi:hypothetical protein